MISFIRLQSLKWDNITDFSHETKDLLETLSKNKELLRNHFDQVYRDPVLLQKSESNPTLSKVVLFADWDIEVRLHMFNSDQEDKPHDHRWSFSSRILHGGYQHRVYSIESEIDESLTVSSLNPIYERYEGEGSTYSIDHSIAHTTCNVAPDTVTLIIRGPVMKQRWFSLDKSINKVKFMERVNGKRTQYTQPSMKKEELDNIKNQLITLNII